MSEKYKITQLFKLHFLQNSPFVQLHTSASDCKDVEILLEAFCKSLFSSSVTLLIVSVASLKRRLFDQPK